MYDGGSDVTGYVVEILEDGSEHWYRATAKALKTNEYVAAGLVASKKYRFRVAAINSNGTGEFSEPSAETEPLEKIGESVLRDEMLEEEKIDSKLYLMLMCVFFITAIIIMYTNVWPRYIYLSY